ncbi:glucose-1-phosphate adenylyltransferase [Calditrichota bacterium]
MDLENIITIIMAGGQGKRLFPLTQNRSKPAVPFAGKFKLIDIPISNCLHSGLRKIFVLTQFSSESLHNHIFLTYRFDSFTKDFITVLSASKSTENNDWYQGTADAVRQNLRFLRKDADLVLILSGDHLYRMDFRNFIKFHIEKKADISIAVNPVSYEQAADFGVMKVNNRGRIVSFFEKPKNPEDRDKMRVSSQVFKKFNGHSKDKTHLASTGIYLFNWKTLRNLLENSTYEDFGMEVIPHAIKKQKVFGYFFDGYWEDIGTIKSFFETHMDLTETLPRFNFYDESFPILTRPQFLPGAKTSFSEVNNSIICDGSIVDRSKITRSIIGGRSHIGENTVLDRVVMMGANYYELDVELNRNGNGGDPILGIGKNCEIRNTIIDKNVHIGDGVRLVNERGVSNEDGENYAIRDGIIVVKKNAVIPSGTVI